MLSLFGKFKRYDIIYLFHAKHPPPTYNLLNNNELTIYSVSNIF